MSSGDLNSGPHTLEENALPTEPSVQSHLKILLMRNTHTKETGLDGSMVKGTF